MTSISRAISMVVVAAVITVFSAGVLTARGDSSKHASAARKANLYLSRTSFDAPVGQGVVEALAKMKSSNPPFEFDLLISVHGLQPNVVYNVVGSRQLCAQAHQPANAAFDVTLPATAGTDRFFRQVVPGVGGAVKYMKSARIFENGVRIGCKPTKLYTLARYP